MKIGFGKMDITPRVGVELGGFGPYLLRRSTGVRDRLWARALAVERDGRRLILVSCDLIGIRRETVRYIREQVTARTGVAPEGIMVHCTHTHSGPNTGGYIGWGAPDAPYLEILPHRIVRAAVQAVENAVEATLFHAEVPCEGIGFNREYEKGAPPLQSALDEDWRPQKPELTDTRCHVLRVESKGRTTGFVSSFGCHPVVCCAKTRLIHGDFCGVATNLLEREYPGAVGLFLQGANGDINSCVVHKAEAEALPALDVIAARYARSLRRGLAEAAPLPVDSIEGRSKDVFFSRCPWGEEKLQGLLDEQEKILHAPGADDADREVGMAMVYAVALRRLIAAARRGESLSPPVELQGFRLGPLHLLASPLEVFQEIKNEVQSRAGDTWTLVLSMTNDTQGYAPDRATAAAGGYTVDLVPVILGVLPFAGIHGELVDALAALKEEL